MGAKFPPVKLQRNKAGHLYVKNSAHRTMAAKMCGKLVFTKIKVKHEEI